MKSLVKRSSAAALAGLLLCLAFVPAAHAVEILRWERLPLAVPLVVGQERVVFIERNVRIGVPAGVGEQLRVQSAGGAIYLRASAPIPQATIMPYSSRFSSVERLEKMPRSSGQ